VSTYLGRTFFIMIFFPMQIHVELLLQFVTTTPRQCLRLADGILASTSWRPVLPSLALIEWLEPTLIDMFATTLGSTKQTVSFQGNRTHASYTSAVTTLHTFDNIRFDGGLATRFGSQTQYRFGLNLGRVARPIALASHGKKVVGGRFSFFPYIFRCCNGDKMARMDLFTGDAVGKVDNAGMAASFLATANNFFAILDMHTFAPTRSATIDEGDFGIFDKELVSNIVSSTICHLAILVDFFGGPVRGRTEY
jgi:hypothetical protein